MISNGRTTTDREGSDAELLERAIEASGLSARRFAREVLIRDERTIRRWLVADRPMPEVVVWKCRQLLGLEA
jgi:hypothetical protein